MNPSSQRPQPNVDLLLSFLNDHSPDKFTAKDVQPLFENAKVAQALEGILDASLHGQNDNVLSVDELRVYESLNDEDSGGMSHKSAMEILREVETMTMQSEMLNRQINSMKRRLRTLHGMSNTKDRKNMVTTDEYSGNMQEVLEEVYNEKLLLSRHSNEIIASLEKSSNQDWLFTNVKYFQEFLLSDEQLLNTLDIINKDIFVSNEDTTLATEIDTLSLQLSDAQFRLFTAQISHAYLISLSQPPTPIRNPQKAHVYTITELKSLQSEIETLVVQCQEATRLLARQMVMDQVSVPVFQGRVDQMEKELDVVERIENVLEEMIGRMLLTKELLLYDMSKIEAFKEILGSLAQQITSTATKKHNKHDVGKQRKSTSSEVSPEITILQSLTGIRDMEDVKKILDKRVRLEKELYEANLRHVQQTIDETNLIVEPLAESLYAESATKEIKFLDPDLIETVRLLEQRIEEVKGGISQIPKNSGVGESGRFVEKWRQHGNS